MSLRLFKQSFERTRYHRCFLHNHLLMIQATWLHTSTELEDRKEWAKRGVLIEQLMALEKDP